METRDKGLCWYFNHIKTSCSIWKPIYQNRSDNLLNGWGCRAIASTYHECLYQSWKPCLSTDQRWLTNEQTLNSQVQTRWRNLPKIRFSSKWKDILIKHSLVDAAYDISLRNHAIDIVVLVTIAISWVWKYSVRFSNKLKKKNNF